MPTDRTSPYQLLLPTPRSVAVLPGTCSRQTLAAPPDIDRTQALPPGAYTLAIDDGAPRIEASDEAGARHARATLDQIRRISQIDDHGGELPKVRIEDAPALDRRGVMLDVSRCRVPRMQELACVVDAFASVKLNHLQCYTEHAFAYPRHPAVWEDADPITPAEARSLDGLCARHGIELAANQNCFGHLTRWLRLDDYAHLAETHGDWTFAGMPRSGPFSLCPEDPRSLAFVEGLLDELIPCFESSLVNIGCDETYDIGQGRSAEAVAERSKAAVYGDFVAKVCDAVIDRGKTPMFWADIAAEHPEALERVPTTAHALAWGYEPGHPFAEQGAIHRDAGRPWWACPGTSSWRSFTGRSRERRHNIREAAAGGVSAGARGLLLTDWGDLGHRQVWPIALLAIAEAADAAWTGADRADAFLDAASLHLFDDRSRTVCRWLEELGDADEPIRALAGPPAPDGTPTPLANASALFTELHPPPLALGLPDDPAPWLACKDRLADLGARTPGGAGPLIEAELRHAVECADWTCDVALSRRGVPTDIGTLRVRRDAIKAEQQRLWAERSRPGGLAESLDYWEQIDLEGTL